MIPKGAIHHQYICRVYFHGKTDIPKGNGQDSGQNKVTQSNGKPIGEGITHMKHMKWGILISIATFVMNEFCAIASFYSQHLILRHSAERALTYAQFN